MAGRKSGGEPKKKKAYIKVYLSEAMKKRVEVYADEIGSDASSVLNSWIAEKINWTPQGLKDK